MGDVGQLEQVILNIAVNAQDAMPDGGILEIATARVDLDDTYAKQKEGVKPGPYVRIAISDTGVGMDAGISERMFEPFFTTKEKGKGTGLGMSTAYGIIKQHGGNIWVYSEPGRGTTIKLYLPVPGQPTQSRTPPVSGQSDVHGSETVLVAEDDPQVRNLASTVLARYGYHVLAAGSGREAISSLERHEGDVHLLLTDVVMPDMNGKELFEHLSARHPDLRVLYMSGYTDDVIAHHGVIDEGVSFIEKPFTVKGLAEKVREAFSR
jgi:CheY-like chemotaxis protein